MSLVSKKSLKLLQYIMSMDIGIRGDIDRENLSSIWLTDMDLIYRSIGSLVGG